MTLKRGRGVSCAAGMRERSLFSGSRCYLKYHRDAFKLYRKTQKVLFSLAVVFELYTERAQQLSKMATGEEKAFAVLEFHSHQSVVTVQRHFRTKFEKDAPCANYIRPCYAQFKSTGCLCKGMIRIDMATTLPRLDAVKCFCMGICESVSV